MRILDSCIKASKLSSVSPDTHPLQVGNITPAMHDTLGASTDTPEVLAHSGPAKASPFVSLTCRMTLWNNGACSKSPQIPGGEQAAEPWPDQGTRGDKKPGEARSSVPLHGSRHSWASSRPRMEWWEAGKGQEVWGLQHMQHNRSLQSLVQAFVTVHMQRAMAEDHCSSVSSLCGRDLKTAPSQGAFKAVSRAHGPEERKCR